MAKYVAQPIGTGFGAQSNLNQNFEDIEDNFQRVLYRDGSSPNQMESNIDMNGFTIYNASSVSADSMTINGQLVVANETFVTALPDPIGQGGKFIKSDGAAASWQNILDTDVNVTTKFPVIVSTVADMKALTGLVDGAVVCTTGYTQAGVGAGRYLVSTSVGTDTGFKVINNNANDISFYLLEYSDAAQAGVLYDGTACGAAVQRVIDAGEPVKGGVGTIYVDTNLSAVGSDKCVFLGQGVGLTTYLGPTTGSLISGSVDSVLLANATFNGNRQVAETQTSASTRIMLDFTGNTAGTPSARLVVSNVRFTNTAYHALAVEHYDRVQIERVFEDDLYGNGIVVSGSRVVIVDGVEATDVGNLRAEGSRSGSAVIVNGRSASTQSVEDVVITNVVAKKVTDSAVYVGDGQTQGNSRCVIANINVNGSGKDGVKYEAGFSNAVIGNIKVHRAANVSVRLKGNKITASNINITEAGYDSVGVPYSGGTGEGQSLQLNVYGLNAEGDDITIVGGSANDVFDNPDDGADGNGFYGRSCARLKLINFTARNCDSTGVRLEGCSDYELDITTQNCGRNTTGTTAGCTIGSFGGSHSSGDLSIRSKDDQGTKTQAYAFRVFTNNSARVRKSTAYDTDHLTGVFTNTGTVWWGEDNLFSSGVKSITGSTNPNVEGYHVVVASNGGATNVQGVSGSFTGPHRLTILSTNANTTLVHNGTGTNKFIMKGGANVTLPANTGMTFEYIGSSTFAEV